MPSTCYACQILMNLEISRQIVEKHANIKFYENPCSGNRVVHADVQTDITKLVVGFREFCTLLKRAVDSSALESNWLLARSTDLTDRSGETPLALSLLHGIKM